MQQLYISYPVTWTNTMIMNNLERRIILNSMLYYEHNTNSMSDTQYNAISQQLSEMKESFPDDFNKTMYAYVFRDFDGSTGFDLFRKLRKEDKEHLMMIQDMFLKKGVV